MNEFEEKIEYMLGQEIRTIESELAQLSWLAKKLGITDEEKLMDALEFAELFNKCNRNGWIELKEQK